MKHIIKNTDLRGLSINFFIYQGQTNHFHSEFCSAEESFPLHHVQGK